MAFRFAPILKALTATPDGLLTLQTGRGGIAPTGPGAFAGSSMFGFPRSNFVDGYYYSVQNASYAYMWQTQPHVRSVVGILSSNFAQVAMKLYEENDGHKEEDTLHSAVRSLRSPNDWQDDSELIEAFASDFFIFDNAYLIKIRPPGADRTTLMRIPAYAMGVRGANRLRPDGYRVVYADGTYLELDPQEVIHWRGYNAVDPRAGWSKMETLRQELIAEATRQAADIEFNRGGRVRGGIIKRPLDAPELDETGLKRLGEAFGAAMRGVYGGKTPVLDEGMDWVDAGVTPKEAEALTARMVSLAEVCHIYGVHPDTMGVFLNGSGNQLVEARKQLYEDVLPPLFRRCAGVFTKSLVEIEYHDTSRHFRFDIKEKLEGNVLERMKSAVTITGRPFVTTNEMRREFGLPDVPGGDQLVTPANVITGGQPSPHTMVVDHATSGAGEEPAPNSPAATAAPKAEEPHRIKALGPEDGDAYTKALQRRDDAATRRNGYATEMARLMRRHFNRQAESLKGKSSAASLDSDRWNKELADDIYRLSMQQVTTEGDIVAKRLMGEFDPGHVEHYMQAMAKAVAQRINSATQAEVDSRQSASTKSEDDSEDAEDVLAVAASSRADEIGDSRATAVAAFATMEAAKQNEGSGLRTKQWVWSGAADSRHGGLANEAVHVYDEFSNGGQYPGDHSLGTEQTARCRCALDVY